MRHIPEYGDGYGIRLRTSDYKIFRTRLRSVLEFQELFQPVLFPYFGIQKKSVPVSVPVLYFEIFSVLRTRTRTRTFPVLIPYRFPYSYSVQFLPSFTCHKIIEAWLILSRQIINSHEAHKPFKKGSSLKNLFFFRLKKVHSISSYD